MSTPQPRLVAHAVTTESRHRPVWGDERGQYVVSENEVKVCGVRLIPPEEADVPVLMDAR